MPDPEFPLSGGQMTAVVRVGDTVRRLTGPWSPAVHILLRYLDARGFAEAPRLLGLDEHGREVLTYVDGEAGFFSRERIVPSHLWSDQVLIQAVTLLRRFHDATIGLRLPVGIQWKPILPCPPPHEVICHNDFGPYNCIFRNGRPLAAIDFDGAAPGSRVWDLAYTAYTFVPLYTDDRCQAFGLNEPQNRGYRLRLLCDAYGLHDRSGFVEVIEERLHAVMTMIQAQAAAGDRRFQRKLEEGHIAGYKRDLAYLRRSRSTLQTALAG